jgi:hypothetical protein
LPADVQTGADRRRLSARVVAALPFIVSNGVAGVVMGVAYKGLELGLAPAVLFSLVVCSATAQAVALGMWTLSRPAAAMMVACIATGALAATVLIFALIVGVAPHPPEYAICRHELGDHWCN